MLRMINTHWLTLTLIILTVITLLSLTPLPQLPDVPGSDKTHHLIAYAVLMFPVALRKPVNWLWIALIFVAWSGAIELIQPYVNRYGEWADMVANCIGLGCGYMLALLANLVEQSSEAA